MRVFPNEEAFQSVRASMETMLVPGARLPEMVFRDGWRHFVVIDGDDVRWHGFFPRVCDFLRSLGESELWVVSLDPAPEAYWEGLGLYGVLGFSVDDDAAVYDREMRAKPGAANALDLDVAVSTYFVGSGSADWGIVAQADGGAGIVGFRNETLASAFVAAYGDALCTIERAATYLDDAYSGEQRRRLRANYAPAAYPVAADDREGFSKRFRNLEIDLDRGDVRQNLRDDGFELVRRTGGGWIEVYCSPHGSLAKLRPSRQGMWTAEVEDASGNRVEIRLADPCA